MSCFQLEWKEHDKTVCTRLWNLFKEQCILDFRVKCRGKYVKAHKLIMSLFCPVSITAHELIFDKVANHIEDVCYLIEFIYRGKVTVPEEHILCLMKLAKNIGFEELVKSLGAVGVYSNVDGSTSVQKTDKQGDKRELRSGRNKRKRRATNNRKAKRRKLSSEKVAVEEDLMVEQELIAEVGETVEVERGTIHSGAKRREVPSGTVSLDEQSIAEVEKAVPADKLIVEVERGMIHSRAKRRELQSDTVVSLDEQSIAEVERAAPAKKLIVEVVKYAEHGTIHNGAKRRELQSATVVSVDEQPIAEVERAALVEEDLIVDVEEDVEAEEDEEEDEDEFIDVETIESDETQAPKTVQKQPSSRKPLWERIEKCNHCDYETHNKQLLVRHMAVKHGKNPDGSDVETTKCVYCDYVCYTKRTVELHMRSHNRPKKIRKTFNCTECDHVALSRRDLMLHDRFTHQDAWQYKCMACGFASETRRGLSLHMTARHPATVEKHKCDICGEEYSDIPRFMESHCGKDEYEYVCGNCGIDLFECSEGEDEGGCDRVAADGERTKKQSHRKNFKCVLCDFACYTDEQLRCHVLTRHEQFNRFKCERCSYTTAYESNLSQHVRITHDGKREHVCMQCECQFRTIGERNHHVSVAHGGENPYTCSMCEREYNSRLSFKLHMQSHFSDAIELGYHCYVCGLRFKFRRELRSHMKMTHAIALENCGKRGKHALQNGPSLVSALPILPPKVNPSNARPSLFIIY